MFDNLNAIASRIQKKLSGGVVTDENRYSLSLIKDAIHAARAFYISEKLKKEFSIPQQYYQTIDCLEIKCEEHECDGIKSGKISITVDIPDLIGGVDYAIKYAGDVKGLTPFTQIKSLNPATADNFPFVPKNTTPRYLYLDKKLELFDLPTPNMKYFKVVGLFANPADDLIRKCGDDKKPYPVGGNTKVIEDLVTTDFIRTLVQIRPDLYHDSVPNS